MGWSLQPYAPGGKALCWSAVETPRGLLRPAPQSLGAEQPRAEAAHLTRTRAPTPTLTLAPTLTLTLNLTLTLTRHQARRGGQLWRHQDGPFQPTLAPHEVLGDLVAVRLQAPR